MRCPESLPSGCNEFHLSSCCGTCPRRKLMSHATHSILWGKQRGLVYHTLPFLLAVPGGIPFCKLWHCKDFSQKTSTSKYLTSLSSSLSGVSIGRASGPRALLTTSFSEVFLNMFSWSNVSCNLEFDCVVFFKSIDLNHKKTQPRNSHKDRFWVGLGWLGNWLTPCDGVENPTVDLAMRMTIMMEFDGNKGHLASATYNPQKLLVLSPEVTGRCIPSPMPAAICRCPRVCPYLYDWPEWMKKCRTTGYEWLHEWVHECNTIVGVPSHGWADRVSVGSLLRAS